jgi:hypothetical protein
MVNRDLDETVISVDLTGAVSDEGFDALGATVIITGRHPTADDPSSLPPSELTQPTVRTEFAVRIGASVVTSLEVPVIVGRRPRTPRIIDGPPPRLLPVDSPKKEVSASHLRIRQLGSSLVITDLRSTNGSIVTVPGAAPRRLRQGESVVVGAGSLVDIGDGNVVEVLAGESAVVGRRQP